ncbi:pyruvate ferredoxin oxidoreductase subunit gamma [Chloroflexota bacterium]
MIKQEPVAIRLHGRGGQGSVTCAELVAQAAIDEGKYAQAFPSFGPERRGAPVQAFIRIDDSKPIRVRAGVVNPDIVVVLDPSLLDIVDVTSGLKEDGILVINTRDSFDDIEARFGKGRKLAIVDATGVARECIGRPIVNTAMIGAFVKASGVITLESLLQPLSKRFGYLAGKNISAMQKAYNDTSVKEKV